MMHEIVDPQRDPAINELMERLEREHEEKESATREMEKDPWIRILLQEVSLALIQKIQKTVFNMDNTYYFKYL